MLNLLTEINIFEGLMHNSENILKDLFDDEKYKLGLPATEKDKIEIERLMHAKELADPDDILSEIMPILNYGKRKQIGGLSDYIEKANQRYLNPDYKKIDKEIEFIKDIDDIVIEAIKNNDQSKISEFRQTLQS